MSGNALLDRIDAYAQAIRERRPLTTDEVKELDAYFRIGMTYTSNALEGNSLTLSETKVLLEDGITVGGKPIRDGQQMNVTIKAQKQLTSVPEFERILPAIRSGAYLPGVDHQTPPDVSMENYAIFVRLLKEYAQYSGADRK